MSRKRGNRLLSLLMITMLFVSAYTGTAQAKWNVKVSNVDYYVEMDNAYDVFICNKESIGSAPGTEYYMTYTVESMKVAEYRQQGIVGANNAKQRYPYASEESSGGVYKFDLAQNKMLVEGYTYFLKFVVTENGFEYKAAWAEDEENQSRYIEFEHTYEEGNKNLEYFGIGLCDAGMTGKLTRIRFYDKYGNDLGVQLAPGSSAIVGREKPLSKDTEVGHTYQITVKNGVNVAISNKRVPTGNKVYMEYKVKSSDTHIYQTGGILSNAPEAGYPYSSGQFIYEQYEYNPETAGNGSLLTPGAEYLVIFEKKEDTLEVTAQRTLNGKSDMITFPLTYGTFYKDAQYYSLWFGEDTKFPVNFVLTDFKCYDQNKNNLSVQSNSLQCEIIHYGELEDYSGCEAMYYCENDDTLYALYEDKALKYTEAGVTRNGEYKIEDGVITIHVMGKDMTYDYLYHYFKNEEGKTYERLHTYRVMFETGAGSKVEEQTLSAENGYVVMRPAEPTCEGNIFEGWYTSDGEKYEFGTLETESLTLYAKWAETEYADGSISGNDMTPYLVMAGAILILLISAAGSIVIIKRGKKHGE